jgi:hypothetical protein
MELYQKASTIRRQPAVQTPALNRCARISLAALAFSSGWLLAGCGSAVLQATLQPTSSTISVTPSAVNMNAAGTQQFVATVTNSNSSAVTWTVNPAASSGHADAASSAGSVSSSGLYTAPSGLTTNLSVQVTATCSTDPSISGSATITILSPTITVTPETANITAGATQAFTASLSNPTLGPVQWLIDGVAGGSLSTGTISASGVYTAPSVDPGSPVTIAAVSSTSSSVTGTATATIVNPPQPVLTGISYAKLLSSWNDTQLPWIAEIAGLEWDANNRAWNPVSGWSTPSSGVAPQIFYLYTALDPITEMAIAKQDISLMEELALFHVALLKQRTTTIGTILQDAPAGAYIFISGAATDRTFTYQTMYTETQVEVAECELCDARYLLSAARLLHAIASLPREQRTAPLTSFTQSFSGFLASEQLIRMLYGSTPWSHWDNPNIPQPLVSSWSFLAETGYEPPHPIKYQAAMTDAELWILAASAEVLGADAAAPELNILDSSSRSQLMRAVAAGTSLLAKRSQHVTAPDGADALSTLAGDYDDHPDFAFSAYEGPDTPTVPGSRYGLMTDTMHSSILAPVYQSLYENLAVTGNSFPALSDVVSLGNTFVHLTFDGNSQLPDFNNYTDGWNGWFRVGDSDIPGGYPPHEYCNAQLNPNNCMLAGALQGWGHLAAYNPDLTSLEQSLIALANDDSTATAAFKDRHYWYNGPYSANAEDYSDIMIYIGGDMAVLVN